MSTPNGAAAEQALRAARRSQRQSTPINGLDPRKFTLNRQAAKEIRDAQVATAMAEWLTQETGQQVRGESAKEFCEDLEDGVVLCKLATRFGQITRFRDPPKNEFQRLENFELFAKSMARLGLVSAPPPSRKDFPLSAVLPCLLEMALLAQKHASALEIDSTVPGEVLDRAAAQDDEDEKSETLTKSTEDSKSSVASTTIETPTTLRKDVVIINNLDEEDDDPNQTMNHVLGQLHLERMKRQRAGPPKLRIIDVGGRQIVAIERPGEAIGSIIWQGSLDMIHYLHTNIGKPTFSADNKGTILELGAGCGALGVWAACEGGDVVVTDTASSIDLLWANVAANAQQIVKNGGSCSARPLDFTDGPAIEKLVRSLSQDGPLTLIAADVVYNETVRPLLNAISKIYAIRPDTKMYLAYKERDAIQELSFFDGVEFTQVGTGVQSSNGDKQTKIYLITGMKQ